MNKPSPLPPAILRWQHLVFCSYYGLIIYFAVNSVLAVGFGIAALLVVWLIQIAPLLLFAPGLHRRHLRTYAWLCFVVLLYFIHGVLLVFDPSRIWLGLTEVVLCVALFACLFVFIRQYRAHFQVPL